ncbi:MAG TPA: SpoIIE family protein phosphatase [Anaerolineae bacterium]|nr:SpoIIE family protein phosphatase [Anaerolineae bacterium]
MDVDLLGIVKRIKPLWQSLTDGGLCVITEGGNSPGSIRGKKLPATVRHAVREKARLEPLEIRGNFWWVISPSPYLRGQVQLVAWATEDRGWKDLLQSWTDMLTIACSETAVADRLTEALVEAWDRLTFLYELTHIAGHATELPSMLNSIVRLLSQVVSAEEVFIVTVDDAGWESVTASGQPLVSPSVLVENVYYVGRPLGLAELKPALERVDSPLAEVGDLLIAPLIGEGDLSGVIGLMDSQEGCFDSSVVQLLASVAEQVGGLIQAAKARVEREESQRLEHELEIAAGIQASLLPTSLPQIPGLELVAYLRPARHIGGDFYDVAEAKTGEPMLMLADVAGKGSPAAILTAVVHATFRGEALHRRDPAELLRLMNRLLHPDLEKAEAFVTAVIVRLESDGRGFSYASAGHADCVLWRRREEKVELLGATGLPLGIDSSAIYRSEQITLDPGDILLLYSDGVTEAENPDGGILGLQGLSDIIDATYPARAEEQIKVIVESLDVYRHGLPLRDDVALMMVRALNKDEEKAKVFPFVIPAEVLFVRQLVDLVRNLSSNLPIRSSKLRRQVADNFALAISEVVTNQIQHAFSGQEGQIHGRISIGSSQLIADLYDRGAPFQPPDRPIVPVDPDDPPERGYGLRLVRGLLDRVETRRLEGGRNHWHLVKELTGVE